MVTITDAKIRALKYPEYRKFSLGGGHFVQLTKTMKGTSKHFKYDYSVYGKRKQISFGKYPDVSLAEAMEKHREARKLVAKNIDPVEARRQERQVQIAEVRTLDTLAKEYFESRNDWKPSHRLTVSPCQRAISVEQTRCAILWRNTSRGNYPQTGQTSIAGYTR